MREDQAMDGDAADSAANERLLRIGELAGRAGVSVRMLRHYDAMGLLRPVAATESGYRLYDRAALNRLRRIRYLRSLDFPLEEIARMLDGAQGDAMTSLRRHRDLMQKKRAQIDAILACLDQAIAEESLAQTEEDLMAENEAMTLAASMQYEEMKRAYAAEARERWGHTDAYKESARRSAARTKEQEQTALAEMDAILAGFAAVRTLPHDGKQAMALAAWLQSHITQRYYPCTDEIFAGLGAMYGQDERFAKNIDRHGEGTAAFMSRAIAAFLAAKRATKSDA